MTLLTSLEDGLLTLTLNRGDKRNALSTPLLDRLHEALEKADLDAEVRVVALRGAGKDFCAGADLSELLASADRSAGENEKTAFHLGKVFLRMRELPKPVVAVVHGRALAGGAGLATACDLVLMAGSATIGYPEIQRGFVPAMVLNILRRITGEKVAFDLAATGRILKADEAAMLGLASRVIPDDVFDTEVTTILRRLTGSSASALALTKRQFYALDGKGFEEGLRLGAKVNAAARSTPDFRDAISRFLKK
ncbi:MAG: enoyl-CoA hydratase/isomerase family protein [Gemmatimonadales bacterium]